MNSLRNMVVFMSMKVAVKTMARARAMASHREKARAGSPTLGTLGMLTMRLKMSTLPGMPRRWRMTSPISTIRQSPMQLMSMTMAMDTMSPKMTMSQRSMPT